MRLSANMPDSSTTVVHEIGPVIQCREMRFNTQAEALAQGQTD